MTKLLEEAIAEVSKLSQEQQDSLAAILLEEIASEAKWEQLFAGSQEQLAKLADEALAEFRQGKTKSVEESCAITYN